MPEQLIKERLESFIPEYQEFLTGDFIIESTTALAREEDLDGRQLFLFQNTISLYLLCFFDIDEAVDFFSTEAKLPVEIARPLIGGVLSALPEVIVASQAQAYELFHGQGEDASTENTAEQLDQPTNPVRTMENDKEAVLGEQTFASNQDAILRPNQQPPQA